MPANRRPPRTLSPDVPVASFPTPDVDDLLLIQDVDTRVPNYLPGTYGDAHPDSVLYPNFTLVFQGPVDEGENLLWVRRVYAKGRTDQDAYNFAIKYGNQHTGFPIYIRTYVLPRAGYTPPAIGSADPLHAGATFVSEEVTRLKDSRDANEDQRLDSLFIKVVRAYETLPGAPLTTKQYGSANAFPQKFQAQRNFVTTVTPVLPSTLPDALSSSVVESRVKQEDNANRAEKTTVTIGVNTDPLLGKQIISDFGGAVAVVEEEAITTDTATLVGGFGTVGGELDNLGNGYSISKKLTVSSFAALGGVQIDARFGVPFHSTKQIVDASTAADSAGVTNLQAVEVEPKDQWHSWKTTTVLADLPDDQVWYGRRREPFPEVLHSFAIVGVENWTPVPTWRVAPDAPLKARFTRKFTMGPPTDPNSTPAYWSEPFNYAIEFENPRQTISSSTGTSTRSGLSSGTSSSITSSTTTGTTTSTTTGTSTSTSSSTSSGTTTSTSSGTSSGTNSGTGTSTATGTSTSTSSSTNSNTGTNTTSGTSGSSSSSTGTNYASGINGSNDSRSSNTWGEGKDWTATSDEGFPTPTDDQVYRSTTSSGSSGSSQSSNGGSSSSGASGSTQISSGTNSGTNSSTANNTSSGTSSSTSSNTNSNTNSGTQTGTNTSTNSGTSSGTTSNTNSGTSSGTNSSTTAGTHFGTNSSTTSGTSTGTESSTSSSISSSTGKSTFRVDLPRCLRAAITVTMPLSAGTFTIPPTRQTALPWNSWVEVGRQSEHWKMGVWVTEITEVFLPAWS